MADSFRSKLPAGALSNTDGSPTNQARSYLQDIEKNVSSLQGTIETKSNNLRTINEIDGTTYTFGLGDSGAICEFTNASAVSAIVPSDEFINLDIGTQIDLVQIGAGKVTLSGDGGAVVINSAASQYSIGAQYATAFIYKRRANYWILGGSLTP